VGRWDRRTNQRVELITDANKGGRFSEGRPVGRSAHSPITERAGTGGRSSNNPDSPATPINPYHGYAHSHMDRRHITPQGSDTLNATADVNTDTGCMKCIQNM
jgi:hypothetical protein